MSDNVTIRDVGPRDGLQSIAESISVEHKIEMVNGLAAAGIERIEVGSFVSPKAVPQMANSAEVLTGVDGVMSREVLVVNERGAREAVERGVDRLVGTVSVSNEFSQRNVRMTTAEATERLGAIAEIAAAANVPLGVDLSTCFGCAFEGPVPVRDVVDVSVAVAELGVDEVVLADTIGAGAPTEITAVVGAVRDALGDDMRLGLHLHDTRGMALANAVAGLDAGIRYFDASVGGLGGCPFSPGATGNVCTEDLVHMFHAMGLTTGIDLDRLIAVAARTEEVLGSALSSSVLRAGPRFVPR